MTLTNEEFKYMQEHGLSWQDLYDFPMSWDWWRHYSVYNSGIDPGPDEAPEAMPEPAAPIRREEETVPPGLKRLWEEIKQLRQGLHYTQKLQQHLQRQSPARKRRRPSKGVPT